MIADKDLIVTGLYDYLKMVSGLNFHDNDNENLNELMKIIYKEKKGKINTDPINQSDIDPGPEPLYDGIV